MLSLVSVEYYLPETVISLSEKNPLIPLTAGERTVYTRFYGLKNIPISYLSILEMLTKVSQPLLNSHNKEKIKLIIHPHTIPILSPYQSLTATLKNILRLPHAEYFGISFDKCVSVLRAFELAANLLDEDNYALIVTGEKIFTQEHRILTNISVIGDAAAAVLVSKQRFAHRLISIAIKCYGKYAKGHWLSQPEILAFGIKFIDYMCAIILETLAKARVSLSDIRIILPHNVNIPCWIKVARALKIPIDKFYLTNISRTGHCFNSDLLINFAILNKNKLLNSGDYYLMATAGAGATFGAAVFQC